VADVIAAAELRGLDFFVITDHDSHMDGKTPHWEDPDYCSERLILLYGVEWTTDWGHANVWSDTPFPYEGLWQAHQAADALAATAPGAATAQGATAAARGVAAQAVAVAHAATEAAHAAGALFSINHPLVGCCVWEYPIPDDVDCLEGWNSCFRYPSRSFRAVRRLWERLLTEGRRIPLVGGSDCHHLDRIASHFNPPGNPTTWVYAEAPTGRAVLDGLASGRATVSYAPYGYRLELTADADGDGNHETMMGEVIPTIGEAITITVQAYGQNRREGGLVRMLRHERHRVVIYRNGAVIRRGRLRGSGDSLTITDTPVERSHYRAELRGRAEVGLIQRILYGRTLAVTNPVYVGDFE
jgi:hypothetical protein